jgi:hypothetical protein
MKKDDKRVKGKKVMQRIRINHYASNCRADAITAIKTVQWYIHFVRLFVFDNGACNE